MILATATASFSTPITMSRVDQTTNMKAFSMSPLECIFSHIHALVNTAWTATNADLAKTTAVESRLYEHHNVITVDIKGVTAVALCVARIILLSTIWHAWRWTRAIAVIHAETRRVERRDGISTEQLQLLEPLQLLAYGAAAAKGVSKLDLTESQRRTAILQDQFGPVIGSGPGTLLPLEMTDGQHVRNLSSSVEIADNGKSTLR